MAPSAGSFGRCAVGRLRQRGIAAAAVLISANWFVYIWAVNHHHVVETSLGYYINPLVSVALGTIVLRERLSVGQWAAVFLAAAGVAAMTAEYGAFPWVAISLALTFGFYGLVKNWPALTRPLA
ncbi:hypothetical protein DI43_07365 [Geobacillus sp. CAMR12739]|nr:hypothetical protein DI43_07365 [Geobacillus sp. CAMR12739]